MSQSLLNHLMVLKIYKEKLNKLDLRKVANEFVRGSEHRLHAFGDF